MEIKANLVEYIERTHLLVITFISIINYTAGLIGGVWLFFEGLFSAVIIGFLYSILGPFVLGFAMLAITFVFGATGGSALFEKRKYELGFILLLLNQIVTIAIVYSSVMFVFVVVSQLSEYANFIPVLFFAYAVSFAPWANLAGKDRKVGNINAIVLLVNGQIGFVLGVILMLITGQLVWVYILFFVGLIFGAVLNIIPVLREVKIKKKLHQHE